MSTQADYLIKQALSTGVYSFDVEHPPELSPYQTNFRLAGVSFAAEGIAYYEKDLHVATRIITTLFADPELEAIAFNGKYDLKCLTAAKMTNTYHFPEMFVDPMIEANLLDESRQHKELGLKAVIYDQYGHEMLPFLEAWAFGEKSKEFAEYATADAGWELRLHNDLKPNLISQGLWHLFTTILMPMSKVAADMEWAGVGWDIGGASKLLRGFQIFREEVQQEIFSEIGQLNLGSGDQVARRLFDELGYSTRGLDMTPSGKRFATDSNAMDKLAKRYPICEKIVKFRTASKMISTYVEPLTRMALEDPRGRIHPTLWLVSTTGRTRMEKPNCFHPSTEILTDSGWVPFSEYDGQPVAQYWHESETIEFAPPTAIIKHDWSGDLCSIQNNGVDLLVTPDHACKYRSRRRGIWKSRVASKYPVDAWQVTAGKYVGGAITLSEDQVILLCATQADGSFTSSGAIDFSFHKSRKTNRLLKALGRLRCVYSATFGTATSEERTRIRLKKSSVPQYLTKHWTSNLLQYTTKTLELIAKEVWHWDGCFTTKNDYCSKQNSNADWIQIVQLLTGTHAKVSRYPNNSGRKYSHVFVRDRNRVTTANTIRTNVPYSGPVHCVTVPSGSIVVRRNGIPAITGNCQNIPAWLDKSFDHLNIRANMVAPTGYKMIVADLSQIELRLCAHVTQDPEFLKAYCSWQCTKCKTTGSESVQILHVCPNCGAKENEKVLKDSTVEAFWHGLDLHQMTTDDVPALDGNRQYGKTANFALIYYATAPRLHYEYPEFSIKQWDEVIFQYFRKYIGVRKWHLEMQQALSEGGVCRDIFGRKRRVSRQEIHKSAKHALNMFINFPVQASACNYIQLCMSNMRKQWIADRVWMSEIYMSNFIHDETVFEVPEHLVDKYVPQIQYWMENSVRFTVPIRADIKVSDNWSEGHK